MTTQDKVYNVALIGDNYVGKTCFIGAICDENFDCNNVKCTLGINSQYVSLNVLGGTVNAKMMDISKILMELSAEYVSQHDLIIMAYDVTNYNSFLYLESALKKIKDKRKRNVPVYLIGFKNDIKLHKVPQIDIENFMIRNDIMYHIATSSLKHTDAINALTNIMTTLIKDLKDTDRYPSAKLDDEYKDDIDIEIYDNKNTIFTNCCGIL
jgi:GTPase SAR1 family protein